MCLEDLRLGKGRQVGSIVQTTAAGSLTQLLPANANRVSLLITGMQTGGGAQSKISNSSSGNGVFLVFSDANNFIAKLRVEDYGELVTGPIFFTDAGGGAVVSITEVISQVLAPAIER